MKTTRGRLRAVTDTDYLVPICPNCEANLAGGAGVALVGASDPFDHPGPKRIVLVFQIQCPECGFDDYYKKIVKNGLHQPDASAREKR